MTENGILAGRTPRLVGSQPGRRLWALSRQDVHCVSAMPFPDLPCCHHQDVSAECFYFHDPKFCPGTAELLLTMFQCCFQAVKFPAEVMWDATGGLLQAQLIPCCWCAKALSAIRMSAESQESAQPVIPTKDQLWKRIMLNFLFICIYEFFWLGFAPCQSCACPRGAVNCSSAFASYFLNTCGSSFQGAVPLICSSKWKRTAAAVLKLEGIEGEWNCYKLKS